MATCCCAWVPSWDLGGPACGRGDDRMAGAHGIVVPSVSDGTETEGACECE